MARALARRGRSAHRTGGLLHGNDAHRRPDRRRSNGKDDRGQKSRERRGRGHDPEGLRVGGRRGGRGHGESAAGVGVAFTPWNFPLTLMANKICPALAAGCTVVLKPASTTPLATQKTIEIINSVGIPAGVLNTVHGPGAEIGDALVSHPKVNKIAFTGQTETGKRIMKLAAENVTRVTLELGGSDPMIVCDDADIRRATAATAIGRFFNAGQACLAVKRVYVFEAIAQEFMQKIADRAAKEWPVGDGLKEGVKMGPLHTERQRAEVEAQVADAVKRGAKVLAGGKRPEGKDFEDRKSTRLNSSHGY